MDFLGLEQRRYEIPTLIVIDSLTCGILITGSIQDIKQHPTTAGDTPKDVDILTNWKNLQDISRELEYKNE